MYLYPFNNFINFKIYLKTNFIYTFVPSFLLQSGRIQFSWMNEMKYLKKLFSNKTELFQTRFSSFVLISRENCFLLAFYSTIFLVVENTWTESRKYLHIEAQMDNDSLLYILYHHSFKHNHNQFLNWQN